MPILMNVGLEVTEERIVENLYQVGMSVRNVMDVYWNLDVKW